LNGRVKIVELDEADRFRHTVSLNPGQNRIGAFGRDEIGNPTGPAAEQFVIYVLARTIVYPTPLRPGDEIQVQDESGLAGVALWIYNLEGDVLQQFESDAQGFDVRFPWSGRDRDGDLARPGYYLMRVRLTTTSGRKVEEVHPLLIRNDE
jgi:hypothetical protein